MTIETKVVAYLVGGALGVVSLLGVHLMYSGHYVKKGVAKCEAATAAANEKTTPITDDVKDAKDTADDEFTEKTENIRTEIRTGITALDLARAQREAQNTGEELGRARAIAEYRAQGGCMSDPLPSDDGLLVIGQSQQRAIFGRVIGSGKNTEAEEVRQNAAPE